MKKQEIFSANPSIMLVIAFFMFCVTNALVVWLFAAFFPDQIVLGTLHISRTWAIIHSVSSLALAQTFLPSFIRHYEIKKNITLSIKKWFNIYLVINAISLWVIGRLADQLGLGLASWRIVLALAIILSVVQKCSINKLKKYLSNQK